jgi:hypothetical protein
MIRRAIAYVALALIAVPAPARATAQSEVAFKAGDDVTRSYPALTGVDPAAAQVNQSAPIYPTPSQCNTSISCDTIPLAITLPDGLVPRVNISVSFRGTSDNLDISVFEPGSTTPYASDTKPSDNPAVLTFKPIVAHYDLVIDHIAGQDTGYTVRWTMTATPAPRVAAGRPSYAAQGDDLGGPVATRTATGRRATNTTLTPPPPDGAPASANATTSGPPINVVADKGSAALDLHRTVAVDNLASPATGVPWLSLGFLLLPVFALGIVLGRSWRRRS